MSGVLTFVAATHKMPLGGLALVAGRAYGTVTIRQFLAGSPAPHPGALDSRLKLNPSISVQEACLFGLDLWPKGQTSGLAHI